MASRVVPGTSLTIARSSRTMELISEDLPTFGRPTIAIVIGCSTLDSPSTRLPWTGVRSSMSAGEGSCSSIASSNSEIPRSCSALTEITFSKPNESNSTANGSCFSVSILLITSTTGFCDLRNIRANSSSTGDNPFFPSTTKRRRSLSRNAFSAACRTCWISSDSPAPKIPPVSHNVNGRSPRVQVPGSRSRVIPG